MRKPTKEEHSNAVIGAIRVLANTVNKEAHEFSDDVKERGLEAAFKDVMKMDQNAGYRSIIADYFADKVSQDVVCDMLAVLVIDNVMSSAAKAVMLAKIERTTVDEIINKMEVEIRKDL